MPSSVRFWPNVSKLSYAYNDLCLALTRFHNNVWVIRKNLHRPCCFLPFRYQETFPVFIYCSSALVLSHQLPRQNHKWYNLGPLNSLIGLVCTGNRGVCIRMAWVLSHWQCHRLFWSSQKQQIHSFPHILENPFPPCFSVSWQGTSNVPLPWQAMFVRGMTSLTIEARASRLSPCRTWYICTSLLCCC